MPRANVVCFCPSGGGGGGERDGEMRGPLLLPSGTDGGDGGEIVDVVIVSHWWSSWRRWRGETQRER